MEYLLFQNKWCTFVQLYFLYFKRAPITSFEGAVEEMGYQNQSFEDLLLPSQM